MQNVCLNKINFKLHILFTVFLYTHGLTDNTIADNTIADKIKL